MSSEYSYTRPKIDEVEIKPNPVDTGATVLVRISVSEEIFDPLMYFYAGLASSGLDTPE